MFHTLSSFLGHGDRSQSRKKLLGVLVGKKHHSYVAAAGQLKLNRETPDPITTSSAFDVKFECSASSQSWRTDVPGTILTRRSRRGLFTKQG